MKYVSFLLAILTTMAGSLVEARAAVNLATDCGSKRTITLVEGAVVGGSLAEAFNGQDSWGAKYGLFSASSEGNVAPSAETPVTIDFVFGDDYKTGENLGVTRFVISGINGASSTYSTCAPSRYAISGSTDGTSWTELVSADGYTTPTHLIIPYAKRGNYRHFRFTFTKNAGYTGTDHGTLFIQNIAIFADAVYYAKPDGSAEADGLTWATATTVANAMTLANAAHYNEIHLQSGTYEPGACLTATKMMTIVGGLAGTGATPEAVVGRSILDAKGGYTMVFSSTTSPGNYQYGIFTHLENLEFRNATAAGVNYTTGHSSLEAINCRFVGNRGNRAGSNNIINGGRGLCFQGTSNRASLCLLKDCEFIDNGLAAGVGKGGMWDGSGAAITHGYATLENCLFASNGVAQATLPNTDGLFGMIGHALNASACLTVRNCRFVRNRGTVGWCGNWPGRLGGATVYATAAGNVFEGCLFLANENIAATTGTGADKRGALGTLTVTSDTRVEGCTFAYNMTDGLTASAGITVNGGTTSVTNSIFYGNAVGSKTTVGADIHAVASAYVNVDHTMLSAASALTVGDASHLVAGAHVAYDNPRFVTALDTMTACRTADGDGLVYYDPAQEATVVAADVHLMTPAGYRKNGSATWYTDSSFTSPAIDAGTGDYANEPAPNGGVRNLGFYGNTSEASKTAEKPHFAIGDVPVQFYAGSPVCPVPTVTDLDTGTTIPPADVPTSFDIAYTGNATYGTALMTLTGKTGTKYAGQSASKEFTISARFYVTNDVTTEGDGMSWAHPMSLTNAIAQATRVTDEILMKAGTYAVSETVLVPRALTIRGGYAGTDDATLADDPVSALDGQGTLLEPILRVAVDTSAAERNVFERMAITRGHNRGLVKTGAASLELRSCQITHNTDGVVEDNYYGIGANIVGSAGMTEVVLSNCLVAANVESLSVWFSCYGRGLSVRSLKSLVMTDCTFVSNGIPHSAERTSAYAFARHQRGWALYASSVPIYATNCVFRANRGCGLGASNNFWGGIVDLEGNGNGTTFDHCLFVGNQCLDRQQADGVGDLHGAVTANFSSNGACDFNFCTFLGNLSDTAGGSAALNLRAGAFTVRNSVFAHNIVGSYTVGGADIRLAGGTLTVANSIFGGKGDKWVLASPETTMEIEDRGNLYGDALTVSSGSEIQTLAGSGSPSDPLATSPIWFGNSAENVAKILAFDAHLLSAGGYRKNGDAAWYEDVNVMSPGVNTADRDAPWANEPAPNGSRANMGCYGNTSEASKTASGEVELPDEISVTYPDGYSQPHIAFTLGGTGAFSATVTVTVRTNENSVAYEQTFVGKARGDEVALTVPAYFKTGDPLIVSVSAEAYGKADEGAYPNTVTAPEPPWIGKKGPANVIHVRAGALGLKDGTSWTDAYDSFVTALGAVTSEKNEIWVAGHFVYTENYEKPTLALPVTIRGGFTGSECTCEERAADAVATLDGNHKTSPLKLNNTASVTVERIAFIAGYGLGIDKTGGGNLTLENCSINGNGWSLRSSEGYGANFTGSAGSTEVTLRNCRIAGNGIAPSTSGYYVEAHDMGNGFGCYLKNLKRATFENCQFVTNGVPYAQPSDKQTGWRSMSASALYATQAPVTMRGCRFLCNRALSTAGTIRLCGGTGGSVFTNCLFVGNQDNILSGGAAWSNGGTLRLEGASAAETYDVVNCTFTANLIDCASAGGAVSVRGGTANVKNCIFDGNLVGRQCTTNGVRDLFVAAGATANVSYSLLSATNTLLAAEGGTLTRGPGVKFGSANFVTNVEKFKNYTISVAVWAGGDLGTVYGSYFLLNAIDDFLSLNCHLRGPKGYADEVTERVVTTYAQPVSPGLDAGDPKDAYDREPRGNGVSNGKRINMGFYGNTPWATRSKAPGFYIVIDGKVGSGPVDPPAPPEPVKTYEDILACDDATASIKIFDGNLELTDTNALRWEWTWTNSSYTSKGYSGFAECKSVDGGRKVALAGGGGWAIVDVATKDVVAYGACGGSPHSIIVLPNDVVAVAVTHTWGTKDQLGVHFFDISGAKALTPNAQNRTHFWMDNPHGFYWDNDAQKLYVSDTEGLHRCSYGYDGTTFSYTVEQTWAISEFGCMYGHDLTRVPNSSLLAITTQEKVLFFDLAQQAWAPSSTFITCTNVKSYDISADGEDILTTIPKPGLNPSRDWVTNELDLYRDGTMKLFRLLPGAEFYKARWIPRN